MSLTLINDGALTNIGDINYLRLHLELTLTFATIAYIELN